MTLSTKALKAILSDYNYWGQSESDSPLKIRRTRSIVNDARILSYDEAQRKALHGLEPDYTVPSGRTIQTKTLQEVFTPLVQNTLAEVATVAESIATEGIETLEMSAEALEYYVQLYSAFKEAPTSRVCYVRAPGSVETGLFIVGELTGETIVAQGVLIET